MTHTFIWYMMANGYSKSAMKCMTRQLAVGKNRSTYAYFCWSEWWFTDLTFSEMRCSFCLVGFLEHWYSGMLTKHVIPCYSSISASIRIPFAWSHPQCSVGSWLSSLHSLALPGDLLDGFIPRLLKEEHPDGVALKALDRTKLSFRQWLKARERDVWRCNLERLKSLYGDCLLLLMFVSRDFLHTKASTNEAR